MISKDGVTLSVNAVLFFYVVGSLESIVRIYDVDESTLLLAQTTLCGVVGDKTLHEILTSREKLSEEVRIACERSNKIWGVKIERVAIKDIILPEVLHRAMASEAEALREARAKVMSAEGERNASQALKDASDVMAKNKIALQLRQLQILTSISHERRLKIYYPFPIEMLTGFAETKAGDSPEAAKDKENVQSVPLPESVISIISSRLEPFMRNPTDILEGESFIGPNDVNRSITQDFPNEPPQPSSSQPHDNEQTRGTQTDPKTKK